MHDDVGMPPRLLVVQNDVDKPFGRIGDALAERGVELDVRFPESGLPTVAEYDGLAVLPGLADPVDDDPAIDRMRATIREALETELPVMGLCLGGQLLVQELGGYAYRGESELAFHEVVATPATASDPLLSGAPARFSIFHAHAYSFVPPPDAVILLENDVCAQACRIGETWAFQCHPEVGDGWVSALAAGLRGEPTEIGPETVSFFRSNGIEPDALERDGALASATLARLAEGIAEGFAARCASYASA